MLTPSVPDRASIYDIIAHKWTNIDYPCNCLDFLIYPETQGVKPFINAEFVKEIISLNVCDAGGALMNVLEEYGPERREIIENEWLNKPQENSSQVMLPEIDYDEETVIGDEYLDQLTPLPSRSFKDSKILNKTRERIATTRERIATAGIKVKEWWSKLIYKSTKMARLFRKKPKFDKIRIRKGSVFIPKKEIVRKRFSTMF
jgi:hypothetical protein